MSGSDYHDFVQLGAEGQVAPTAQAQVGALTSGQLPLVTAQISTQVNPSGPSYGINSIVQGEQQLAVTSSYSAPGSRTAV
jgi:hypothetical protein